MPWAPRAARAGRKPSPARHTITQSVKLTSDLSCGASDGLDVGADHVTVDLGGNKGKNNGQTDCNIGGFPCA